MEDIPRLITGILLVLAGLSLVVIILLQGNYVTLDGASLILLILGIVILSNKKENKIEEIKRNRR